MHQFLKKHTQDDIVMPWYTHLGDKIIKKLEKSQDSGYFWQEGGTCDWDEAHGRTLRWLFKKFVVNYT